MTHIIDTFPNKLYNTSPDGEDLPTHAKNIVSIGTLNVSHEAPYVPVRFQGEIWRQVLTSDARAFLTKAFAFNRVSQIVESGDLRRGTALEREVASQANIPDASHYYE